MLMILTQTMATTTTATVVVGVTKSRTMHDALSNPGIATNRYAVAAATARSFEVACRDREQTVRLQGILIAHPDLKQSVSDIKIQLVH